MVRIAISQAAFDARSLLALLMILLAAPACAGSRFGGGRFPRRRLSWRRLLRFPPQRRSRPRFLWRLRLRLQLRLGFRQRGLRLWLWLWQRLWLWPRLWLWLWLWLRAMAMVAARGNAASISNGLTGGYVPDPVGADIPPLIIPTNCWVRRAAYDPSGAYFGQVLVNLCRPSDSVTVTGLKARPKTPDTGAGTAQPPPVYRSGSPQLPQ